MFWLAWSKSSLCSFFFFRVEEGLDVSGCFCYHRLCRCYMDCMHARFLDGSVSMYLMGGDRWLAHLTLLFGRMSNFVIALSV